MKHAGGSVLTLVSGKGGVGQTNLALNLAIHFARCARAKSPRPSVVGPCIASVATATRW